MRFNLHSAGPGPAAGRHPVRLAALQPFAGFITGYGLEFALLAGDSIRLVRALVDQGDWNPFRVG